MISQPCVVAGSGATDVDVPLSSTSAGRLESWSTPDFPDRLAERLRWRGPW